MTQESLISIRERALEFLGQGYSSDIVAQSLGVTPSRIAQLMAEPEFKQEVLARRVQALKNASDIDDTYNRLEVKLQQKVEKLIPLITKPKEALEALKVINAAKRRGVAADPTTSVPSVSVVQLNMPTALVKQFVNIQKTADNQIIQADDQSLITIQSHKLDSLAAAARKDISHEQGRIKEISQGSPRTIDIKKQAISVEDLE